MGGADTYMCAASVVWVWYLLMFPRGMIWGITASPPLLGSSRQGW